MANDAETIPHVKDINRLHDARMIHHFEGCRLIDDGLLKVSCCPCVLSVLWKALHGYKAACLKVLTLEDLQENNMFSGYFIGIFHYAWKASSALFLLLE